MPHFIKDVGTDHYGVFINYYNTITLEEVKFRGQEPYLFTRMHAYEQAARLQGTDFTQPILFILTHSNSYASQCASSLRAQDYTPDLKDRKSWAKVG